jgi:hypothetical protein
VEVAVESEYPSRAALEPIEIKQRAFVMLLQRMRTDPKWIVFDYEFSPLEYFRLVIEQEWRALLVRISMTKGANGPVPLQIRQVERNVTTLLFTIFWASSFVDFSFQMSYPKLWRDAIGVTSLPSDPQNPLAWITRRHLHFPENVLIRQYYTFYVDLVTTSANQICYSPVYNAYVSRPGSSLSNIENFTSVEELRALCRLVGPVGVRCLHHGLLVEASSKVKEIFQCMESNAQTLEKIREAVKTKSQKEYDSLVRSVKGLDGLAMSCLGLGVILQLRYLFRSAQSSVAETLTPHIHNLISCATKQYNPNLLLETAFLPMDMLAEDCGVGVVGGADLPLIYLTKISVPNRQTHLVRLLPITFSILLHAKIWGESLYIPHLAAYSNNLHLMALGISQAIINFTATFAGSSEEITGIPQLLSTYLEYSAIALLHIAGGEMASASRLKSSYPHMVAFLDIFLSTTCYLTREALESVVPYALIRSMYQSLSQKAKT